MFTQFLNVWNHSNLAVYILFALIVVVWMWVTKKSFL